MPNFFVADLIMYQRRVLFGHFLVSTVGVKVNCQIEEFIYIWSRIFKNLRGSVLSVLRFKKIVS
jgi:hypothetical protein